MVLVPLRVVSFFCVFVRYGADENMDVIFRTVLMFVVLTLLNGISTISHPDSCSANEAGLTSLFAAIAGGDIETVKALIKTEGIVQLRDDQGKTALMYASMQGKKEMADLLIQNGANINERDKKGIRL